MKKLITHAGGFHADDVFAYAILKEYLSRNNEPWELIRTRDDDVMTQGDIVFDVGGIYDADTHRYDHHQRGRAGQRDNGILYAAAGLVWKHFGHELCSAEVWKKIDQDIICELDALDNGQDFIKELAFENTRRFPFAIMLGHFEPTMFDQKNPEIIQESFERASDFARGILLRALHAYEDQEKAFSEISELYKNSPDKKILVSEKNYERPTWKRLVAFPELLFVIYPKEEGGMWKIEAIPESESTMESRKYAPEEWRGYRGEELQKITGVADATFCHPSGFLFAAVSKQGAIELAKKALLM